MGFLKIKVTVIARDKNGRETGRREKESDLILNNFGTWLAGHIRTPAGGAATVTLKDTGGNNRSVDILGISQLFNGPRNGDTGTQVGVGSSSQAPARTDYNLIAQLGSLAGTTDGAWSSSLGRVTYSASIVLAGGGTVREVSCFAVWFSSITLYTFMLFRDNIADLVIDPGGSAFVLYQIQC